MRGLFTSSCPQNLYHSHKSDHYTTFFVLTQIANNFFEPLRSDFCGVYFIDGSASEYSSITLPWPESNFFSFIKIWKLLHEFCFATVTIFSHVTRSLSLDH